MDFDPQHPTQRALGLTRRYLLRRAAQGLGGLALSSLLTPKVFASNPVDNQLATRGALNVLHHPPRAKRVIYLFQSGGPAQHELFDRKPLLNEQHGKPLPDHVRDGQRLTGMSAFQSEILMAGSPYTFGRYGKSGQEISEILPYTQGIADDMCIVRSMFTEAINHDPAITFMQTGSELAGRPCMGSWFSYGLGSMNKDLPDFVVMTTNGKGGQPLYSRLWGSGFLDSRYSAVRFGAGDMPVMYLANPQGVHSDGRRQALDTINSLNRASYAAELDPEIESRIAQYEMAYRLQMSVPEVADLSSEPDETFELYGEDARKSGTYAANCLMARRLAERGVRFIQLYHQGWDQHNNCASGVKRQCQETDQASAALVKDLKRRGMLEDTLVIWAGEFGRTSYSQGELTPQKYGRDHHPRCFSLWMAGGGVKAGTTYGRTDDYGYNIVDADGNVMKPSKASFTPGAVHVHDLQATIMHLMGVDHHRLSVPHQGLDMRLTGVHGHVVKDLLA